MAISFNGNPNCRKINFPTASYDQWCHTVMNANGTIYWKKPFVLSTYARISSVGESSGGYFEEATSPLDTYIFRPTVDDSLIIGSSIKFEFTSDYTYEKDLSVTAYINYHNVHSNTSLNFEQIGNDGRLYNSTYGTTALFTTNKGIITSAVAADYLIEDGNLTVLWMISACFPGTDTGKYFHVTIGFITDRIDSTGHQVFEIPILREANIVQFFAYTSNQNFPSSWTDPSNNTVTEDGYFLSTDSSDSVLIDGQASVKVYYLTDQSSDAEVVNAGVTRIYSQEPTAPTSFVANGEDVYYQDIVQLSGGDYTSSGYFMLNENTVLDVTPSYINSDSFEVYLELGEINGVYSAWTESELLRVTNYLQQLNYFPVYYTETTEVEYIDGTTEVQSSSGVLERYGSFSVSGGSDSKIWKTITTNGYLYFRTVSVAFSETTRNINPPNSPTITSLSATSSYDEDNDLKISYTITTPYSFQGLTHYINMIGNNGSEQHSTSTVAIPTSTQTYNGYFYVGAAEIYNNITGTLYAWTGLGDTTTISTKASKSITLLAPTANALNVIATCTNYAVNYDFKVEITNPNNVYVEVTDVEWQSINENLTIIYSSTISDFELAPNETRVFTLTEISAANAGAGVRVVGSPYAKNWKNLSLFNVSSNLPELIALSSPSITGSVNNSDDIWYYSTYEVFNNNQFAVDATIHCIYYSNQGTTEETTRTTTIAAASSDSSGVVYDNIIFSGSTRVKGIRIEVTFTYRGETAFNTVDIGTVEETTTTTTY